MPIPGGVGVRQPLRRVTSVDVMDGGVGKTSSSTPRPSRRSGRRASNTLTTTSLHQRRRKTTMINMIALTWVQTLTSMLSMNFPSTPQTIEKIWTKSEQYSHDDIATPEETKNSDDQHDCSDLGSDINVNAINDKTDAYIIEDQQRDEDSNVLDHGHIKDEESSDEEVVSFKRRIINRISSNSDSDDEKSYASEDLEEMLEKFAIAKEEELTNAGNSLDNIQWNKFANKQQSFTFTGKNSDDEKSYASEDLEEMLEKFAIAKEEELTNAGNSLDNIQWNKFANKQQSFTFTGKSGLL
ncbi:hypothetical protein WN51_09912 [Melipona quadrifasciata]|uniref:Uncharacterized protein n=1 Tax=Melipona quadrifasciata TaxID=166423 RepID=A0A0N0U789_9HYME|nr:hypothetical protein WN51_09912 [Melipona quadrifasciata]